MGDNRTSTFFAALKLDESPLINQFMFVEELNTADGSFILSLMMKDQVERNHDIILVTCHNSWGHFHSVGQKLGYNLTSLKESGHIYFVNVLEKINSEDLLNSTQCLKTLYDKIKKQVDMWKNNNGLCIIIENIGNFLLVGAEGLISFINYLRVITKERENSSVVLSLHNFPACSHFNKIVKSIRHLADLTVVITDLQTGRANDITGHLTVKRKINNCEISVSQYQYQLEDTSIRVFVPGSRNLF